MQGRVRGAPLWAAAACAVASFATSAPARAEEAGEPSLATARDRYFDQQRGLMVALAAWAGVNLVGGTYLVVVSPEPETKRRFRRGFGAMALAYGAANMALAVGNLASGNKPSSIRDAPELATQLHRATDVYAADVAMDMLYIWVGVTLWTEGSNATARGMGSGMFTQGVFLLGFDTTAATLFRH